jgi:hypothetical protein
MIYHRRLHHRRRLEKLRREILDARYQLGTCAQTLHVYAIQVQKEGRRLYRQLDGLV